MDPWCVHELLHTVMVPQQPTNLFAAKDEDGMWHTKASWVSALLVTSLAMLSTAGLPQESNSIGMCWHSRKIPINSSI